MTQIQINKPGFMKTLRRQLRTFGLDPADWRVARAVVNKRGHLEIRHRDDGDIRLKGKVIQLRADVCRVEQLALSFY